MLLNVLFFSAITQNNISATNLEEVPFDGSAPDASAPVDSPPDTSVLHIDASGLPSASAPRGRPKGAKSIKRGKTSFARKKLYFFYYIWFLTKINIYCFYRAGFDLNTYCSCKCNTAYLLEIEKSICICKRVLEFLTNSFTNTYQIDWY